MSKALNCMIISTPVSGFVKCKYVCLKRSARKIDMDLVNSDHTGMGETLFYIPNFHDTSRNDGAGTASSLEISACVSVRVDMYDLEGGRDLNVISSKYPTLQT